MKELTRAWFESWAVLEPNSPGWPDWYLWLPPDYYIDRIRANDTYSLTRWGDGEFRTMVEDTRNVGLNADGARLRPKAAAGEMGAILLDNSDKLIVGIAKRWFRATSLHKKDQFRSICSHSARSVFKKYNLHLRTVHSATMWHELVLRNGLGELFEACRNYRFCIAGPRWFRAIEERAGWQLHVDTGRDSWPRRDAITAEIAEFVNEKDTTAVVLVSAGMTANVIVHRLFKQFGAAHFFIDLGSAPDPYCGHMSRWKMKLAHERGFKWTL